MLVFRLFRIGKKNQPSFKIIVTDKRRSSTRGRSVEEVGFWNPTTKEKILKQDRIKYWLSVGVKPSASIFNLLVSEKIIEGKKIDVHKKAKEKKGKPGEEKPVTIAQSVPPAASAPVAAPEKTVPTEEAKPTEEKPKEEIKKEEPKEPEKTAKAPKAEEIPPPK